MIMKLRLSALVATLGLLVSAIWAAAPVVVSDQLTTHRIKTSVAYDANRMYPANPPREKTDPLNAQISARKIAVEKVFFDGRGAAGKAALDAKKAWDALPRNGKNTPEAIALKAIWEPVYAEMTQAQGVDAEVLRLKGELQQLIDEQQPVIEATFPLVTLNNGLIEVKIVPTLGMRVLNAVDLRSGQAFCGTVDPRAEETGDFKDVIGWDAGWTEVSFPFFEHGMGVRQSAGYRVIKADDGTVTVAMNMRFTAQQDPRNMSRYGRYSPRILSAWVTIKPGESRYTVTYRVDNPLPLPQGDRIWTNQRMWAEGYDSQHLIYPAGYVMQHGGQTVEPFMADGGKPSYKSVSLFALHTDYEFCGVYASRTDSNSLIINDKKNAPGMKLYTTSSDGGFMEFWCGSGQVFEDPGHLRPGFEPVQYSLTYYTVSGLGRVAFANRDFAITEKDGKYSFTANHDAKAEITDADGKLLAAGALGPNNSLTGITGKRFMVKLDGTQVGDVTFPLSYTDTRDQLKEVSKLGGKFRFELEENCNNIGAPTARDAIGVAQTLAKGGDIADAEYAVSIANTAYRYGYLTEVAAIAKKLQGNPAADLLAGLVAWEKGEPVDFGKAGVEANYHRALLAVQKNNTPAAIAFLDEFIKANPVAYYPRLFRAYLAQDIAGAKALAAENPALPEAQLALELLGVAGAKEAKEALVQDNPDAYEQLEQFKGQITEGKWQFPRRFAPALPK